MFPELRDYHINPKRIYSRLKKFLAHLIHFYHFLTFCWMQVCRRCSFQSWYWSGNYCWNIGPSGTQFKRKFQSPKAIVHVKHVTLLKKELHSTYFSVNFLRFCNRTSHDCLCSSSDFGRNFQINLGSQLFFSFWRSYQKDI